MRHRMRFVLILASLSWSTARATKPVPKKTAPPAAATAAATAASDARTVPVGSEITVEDYDAKTETFLLSFVAEPDVGPNFVTPDNLRRGIAAAGDLTEFMRQKSQMMGSIYQVKTPMPLVGETEMARRTKAAKP